MLVTILKKMQKTNQKKRSSGRFCATLIAILTQKSQQLKKRRHTWQTPYT